MICQCFVWVKNHMFHVPSNGAKMLPLKPTGDLKGTPKRETTRPREMMETYPTVTIVKAPFSLQTLIYGRRSDS